MGHVDHGKTSLLDAIRETEVAAGEAGGITQHIGAYQVHHDDKTITFLDTPGHAAFTAMRARGAKVTDIAVLVVAADDGVMPQTIEAIDHARAAGVPIIIAVNKIDKEGASPTGSATSSQPTGPRPRTGAGHGLLRRLRQDEEGLDKLLDMILLVAEVEELGANPDAPASGTVIESQLDPGRGPVVTVLVQRGTLRSATRWSPARSGAGCGRCTTSSAAHREAGPGMPVEMLGFDGVCEAGESVQAVENDRRAASSPRSVPTGSRPRRWLDARRAGSASRRSSPRSRRARSTSSTSSSRPMSPARWRRSRTRSRSSRSSRSRST